MSLWTYRADQEFPSWACEWRNYANEIINFSSGYTFTVKLVLQTTGVTALTKTAGITGAATSPNVTVAWGAGELNITPGIYKLHLTAHGGGGDRVYRPADPPRLRIVATP